THTHSLSPTAGVGVSSLGSGSRRSLDMLTALYPSLSPLFLLLCILSLSLSPSLSHLFVLSLFSLSFALSPARSLSLSLSPLHALSLFLSFPCTLTLSLSLSLPLSLSP